jgi:hypothetical protein
MEGGRGRQEMLRDETMDLEKVRGWIRLLKAILMIRPVMILSIK